MFKDIISDTGGRLKPDIFKASCRQAILYILHFAQFPELISKIKFAISAFGKLIRNVQFKGFHFSHPSHSTELVLMTITLFSMCFAADVETTHSKTFFTFLALFNSMNGAMLHIPEY